MIPVAPLKTFKVTMDEPRVGETTTWTERNWYLTRAASLMDAMNKVIAYTGCAAVVAVDESPYEIVP